MQNVSSVKWPDISQRETSNKLEAYPRSSYAWYVVAILLLAYSVAFVDRLIISLMVQPVRMELHLTDTGVSLLQGFAFAILYTAVGLTLGRWADRHNRTRLIIAGMILWCLATVACGFAQNFTQLFVARVFVGIGEAALSPAAYSILADLFPKEKRGRAAAVYGTGIFVGSGLALIFGGIAVSALSHASSVHMPMVGAISPWRAAFILVGLSGLIAVALATTIREPARREITSQSPRLAEFVRFVSRKRAALAMVIFNSTCVATINFCMAAWLPTYFIRVFKWAPSSVAEAYGVILLTVGCAGMVGGGWLTDRLVKAGRADGAMVMIRWSVIPIPACIVWVGLVSSPMVALGWLAAATFLLGVTTGLGPAALNAMTPNQFRGQVIALLLFTANVIGLGFGPTLVALSTDYLFQNDLAVGKSLALVSFIASVVSVVLVVAGRAAYARAVQERDQ